MSDPLRVPEAVREAIAAALPDMWSPMSDNEIRAVITAALKAEWVGPWRVEQIDARRWKARHEDDPTSAYAVVVRTEAEARAVAAALNITQGGERE